MNFINCIIRLASCTVIQYALVAVSQFMNIDEFRFTLINHNFLCFVLDVASLWNFSSICLSTGLPPLSDPLCPQHIRYSLSGAKDVVELSTPTSKFEHLLISFSFCLLFFYVVLVVFFSGLTCNLNCIKIFFLFCSTTCLLDGSVALPSKGTHFFIPVMLPWNHINIIYFVFLGSIWRLHLHSCSWTV